MKTLLSENGVFSLKHTLECGQCFRWVKQSDGSYFGIVNANAAVVSENDGNVYVVTNTPIDFWRNYFDLNKDYEKILCGFVSPTLAPHSQEFMKKAIVFAPGLRILKQEPWETLVSYIISAGNNISSIRRSVARISESCGKPIEINGIKGFTFPDAKSIFDFGEANLHTLKVGKSVKYIIGACNAMLNGEIDFEQIRKQPLSESQEALKRLKGVGPKVADCVLLFGLSKMHAFPMDTWMNKASEKFFGGKLSPEMFGDFAGIAQEYIFYYMKDGVFVNSVCQ